MAIAVDPDKTKRLRERFEADDPTLTPDECGVLRNSMSVDQWQHLVMAKADRARVVSIGTGRTEAQIAADYRERTLAALGPLVDVINEARREHGMVVSFQIGAPDGFNRQSLTLLEISKKLC